MSGRKFHDLDADGTHDGGSDPGLSGWRIDAYSDSDRDGVVDVSEFSAGAAASAVTDANGDYTLMLAPGRYIVCEALQAGWTQSHPGGATICSAGVGLGPGGWAVKMTGRSSYTNNDFGNFQPVTVSGQKLDDVDTDGVKDAGESGLEGWTIRGYSDADADGVVDPGETFTTAVTDASGNYSFTLNPGAYIFCEVLQASSVQSLPGGADECSAVAGLGPDGYAETLTSGVSETNNDFGNFFPAGTVSGCKFNDLDGDGDDENGADPSLSGWEIRAYADTDEDGVLDAGEYAAGAAASDVIGAGGYSLTVAPGKYIVCEVLQSGWTQSAPGVGFGTDCSAGAGLGPRGWAVTVTHGVDNSGNTFGNFF